MRRRDFLQRASTLSGILAASALAPRAARADPPDPAAARLGPALATRGLERLRGIPGALIDFHFRSPETGDAFTLCEARARPGMEPRPHTHEHEDETMILLEGDAWVRVGDQEFEVGAGESIFMPRRIEHEFKIVSAEMHLFLLINPGRFGEFFWDFGMPLTAREIPPVSTEPPPPEVAERMQAAMREYGITFAP